MIDKNIFNYFNPINVIGSLFEYRYLIGQLTRRDVLLKHRGSFLGIGWSFLYPLLLLSAYTLVFGGIFGGRWGGNDGMKGLQLAIFIYCGLVVFFPFAEVIISAPRLMQANQNFVKKIIFPTETLPLVALLSASVHGVAHLVLLLLAAAISGHLHSSAWLTPIALIPAWLFTLGLAWILAAAGAYIRDLVFGIPILVQLLMFLLPVFYPIDTGPELLRTLHSYNPLALAIEDVRRTVIVGLAPNWDIWVVMLSAGFAFALLGYAFFRNCREEFADVL